MSTIIPIFIHSHNEPPEDPKCPHCKKKLKGWKEPSNIKPRIWFIGSFLGLIILSNLFGSIFGGIDGNFYRCDPLFSKRFHYIIPTYPIACITTRWLVNKEVIFNKNEN